MQRGRWQTWMGVGLLAASCACLPHTPVDLRKEPAGDGNILACPEGQRRNPAHGQCEKCFKQKLPPTEACLCAYEALPGPFPLCDDPLADYECLPCTGSRLDCAVYDAGTQSASSCERFFACCDELLAAGGFPCCPENTLTVCDDSQEGGHYPIVCASCCAGELCDTHDECAAWQHCEAGRCTPACEVSAQYCGGDCTCHDTEPPL